MKRGIKTIIIILTFCSMVFAGNLDPLFEKANKLYMEKKYQQALKEYKKLEDRLSKDNKQSFKLYYNLGCTYFRLNDIANSRYYFEKAKRINPLDKDLNKNLGLLVARLKDKEKNVPDGFFLRIYKHIYQSFSLNTLTLLFVFFVFFVFLVIAMIISNRYEKKKLYYALGIGLFFAIFSFSLFYSRYNYTFKNEGIVFAEEIDVFSEPNTSSTVLFKLHKATKVKIEDELNGYVHISLPDGLNGWIDRQYIKEI